MYGKFQDLKARKSVHKDAGLYKTERLIATPGCNKSNCLRVETGH